MSQVKISLYNFIHMFRYDPNLTHNIMTNNFLHDPILTQCKIKGLRLRNLTRLIKWIMLELTYIILYRCFDTIQTRHAT